MIEFPYRTLTHLKTGLAFVRNATPTIIKKRKPSCQKLQNRKERGVGRTVPADLKSQAVGAPGSESCRGEGPGVQGSSYSDTQEKSLPLRGITGDGSEGSRGINDLERKACRKLNKTRRR